MQSIKQQKKQLRRQFRQKRRNLSKVQQVKASQSLSRYLAQCPEFLQAKHIAIYLANDGEIDLSFLLAERRFKNKSLYVPIVGFNRSKHLRFVAYQASTPLTLNRFGIKEPKNLTVCHLKRLDLVLLPLVAFDAFGHRLGMGGGFYDTTFDHNKENAHCPLIGVAHHIQQVPSLPVESWDIAISKIICNKGVVVAQS